MRPLDPVQSDTKMKFQHILCYLDSYINTLSLDGGGGGVRRSVGGWLEFVLTYQFYLIIIPRLYFTVNQSHTSIVHVFY